jgi:hypothetical protein
MKDATNNTAIRDAVFARQFTGSVTDTGNLVLQHMQLAAPVPYKFDIKQLACHDWPPMLGRERRPVVYDPHYTLPRDKEPLIYHVAINSELPVEDIRHYLGLLDTMKNITDASLGYITDALVQLKQPL